MMTLVEVTDEVTGNTQWLLTISGKGMSLSQKELNLIERDVIRFANTKIISDKLISLAMVAKAVERASGGETHTANGRA